MIYLYRKARKDLGPVEDQEQAHCCIEEEKDCAIAGDLRCLCHGKQEEASADRHGVAAEYLELSSRSLAASKFRGYKLSSERAISAEGCKNEQVMVDVIIFI